MMMVNTLPMTFSTLQPFSINSSSLSITSIQYNQFSTPSEWVDNLLGSKAHFIRKNRHNPEDYPERYSEIRKLNVTPDEIDLWSECSFEILGFVRLDVQKPILRKNKQNKPLLGHGKLLIGTNFNFQCFWRVVFGHYEHTTLKMGATFSSIVFYCPAPRIHMNFRRTKQICADISSRLRNKQINNYEVTMSIEDTEQSTLNKVDWKNKFAARIFLDNKDASTKRQVLDSTQKFAVCLSIPYSSSDPEKVISNGALLAEFIRYYSLLGFKVFVYDRDGMNKAVLDKSPYMVARNITLDFVYYNYTIYGLLNPDTFGMRYDNEYETTKPVLREIQDWDKTLTNTHCRFEVKATQKIQNVLVVDFDEFLYCDEAKPTFTDQKRNIHIMLKNLHSLSFGQISFPQRWIITRTDNPRSCMINNSKNGQSVFDCFGPYKYLAGGFSAKSLYLGHKCVATDFHFSCSDRSFNYNYNCLCQSDTQHNRCNLIHLSSQLRKYTRFFSNKEKEVAFQSKNELYTMTLEI